MARKSITAAPEPEPAPALAWRTHQRSMKNLEDVRVALGWIFRQVETDRLDLSKAKVLIYCSMSLATILKETNLEARIGALEAAATRRSA